jgi:putative PIN family toxin of toxin-antitoxin system
MRLVLDNNILVSALIWQGLPRRVLDEGLEAGWQFYTSGSLMAELERVLQYPHLARAIVKKRQTPDGMLSLVRDVLHEVQVTPLIQPVCRDPDDDAVLACALAAQADLIVSGDQDLLVLQAFEGIQIVTAAQALERLAA